MLKNPSGCSHQFDNVATCAPALLIDYECPKCGETWQDVWSCACDDDCPGCGATIEALDWKEIAPCACKCTAINKR